MLARAQLEAAMVKEAVDSYIKAGDHSAFAAVIAAGERESKFEDLVRYLEMARKGAKERAIDSALVYALAQTRRLAELESFVTSPNVADIQHVGDRTFDEGLYEAARVLFASINNNAKLASTLLALGLFREAVDAAKKANSIRTWKEVNGACIKAGEFRLAQTAGLAIIVSPDHLEELIHVYEEAGHWDELTKLLEQGVGLENAHAGIFTELGCQYARHRPEKLMEHVKTFAPRMNTSKMLRACEAGRHWPEAVFLYTATEDHDQAVRTMTEHAPACYAQAPFLESIAKVRNKELHYAAVTFFLDEEPAALPKLLAVLTPQLDHSRVVHQFKKSPDALPVILPYLRAVQKENLSAVNEAVNALLVDEEDIDGLRASIADFNNFDQVGLAQRLEKHELLELRRVAALLYKRNKRWEQAIALSKQDAQFKDAIDTASESGDTGLAEGLLAYFVAKKDKESFAAVLFTCYRLIRPDVALELSWRNRYTDFAMPFMIQYMRDSSARIAALEAKLKPKEEEAEAAAAAAAAGLHGDGSGGYNTGMLALADTAYYPQYGQQGGMMMQQGMGVSGRAARRRRGEARRCSRARARAPHLALSPPRSSLPSPLPTRAGRHGRHDAGHGAGHGAGHDGHGHAAAAAGLLLRRARAHAPSSSRVFSGPPFFRTRAHCLLPRLSLQSNENTPHNKKYALAAALARRRLPRRRRRNRPAGHGRQRRRLQPQIPLRRLDDGAHGGERAAVVAARRHGRRVDVGGQARRLGGQARRRRRRALAVGGHGRRPQRAVQRRRRRRAVVAARRGFAQCARRQPRAVQRQRLRAGRRGSGGGVERAAAARARENKRAKTRGRRARTRPPSALHHAFSPPTARPPWTRPALTRVSTELRRTGARRRRRPSTRRRRARRARAAAASPPLPRQAGAAR